MAEVIKFNLSGRTGFFKKPDVNTYLYFTYGSIHKIALLGILGAIMGYKGYNQQNEEKTKYPEFYEKLKDLKVSIVPIEDKKGYIPKKIQTFNNSVGYASKEQGGNLIVKEQWLENPEWDIYIMLDESKVSRELKDRLTEYRFEFIPYLGKNDHFANIKADRNIFESSKVGEVKRVNSYFPSELKEKMGSRVTGPWKVEEVLPVDLEEGTNQYISKKMMATNFSVEIKDTSSFYKVDDKILYFG